MTYARARLWLGVLGVGSIVSLAAVALVVGAPQKFLSSSGSFGANEFSQISVVAAMFLIGIAPFDFLGGYWFPYKYQRSKQQFIAWSKTYLRAVLLQAGLFVIFGTVILVVGQSVGVMGAVVAVSFFMVTCFIVRNHLLLNRRLNASESSEKLVDAIAMIQSWQIFVPRTVVVEHNDSGFTGGIVGLGSQSQIVIPKAWLSFSRGQLATAVARRAIAINSGSYSRGLYVAFAWNIVGFLVCSFFPGAGVESVAELLGTTCGFTLWSFLGLLILPTASRKASLKIDQELGQKGMPGSLIATTARTMDQLQDGEPERPVWIETIFHPIPSVTSRNHNEPIRGVLAWNVARTTLFLSWACLGLLSRSVHCNVGRPELWTMLPTD